MDFFIGLDIGTTAIKGALMTADGMVKAIHTGGYHYYGEKNVKLLDPAEFSDVCFSVIKKLTAALEENECVSALCACCASGNLILLDETDTPLIPIIGWQTNVDREDIDAFLSKEEQAAFYPTVGWPLGRGFPAAYLIALKAHAPEKFHAAKTVAMSAEYLNFVLTGKWGISHSMSTPFFLVDQEKGKYHTPFLNKLGLDEKKLPPILDKGTVLG